MSKVEDRIALWLSAHPGSTLVEIARGVHAKDETVRDVLGGPLFTFSLSGKSYRYWLRGSRETSRDEVRRAETDCDFRMLSDGEAHSLNEILRRSFADRGCGLTVHSRAADLRARGYRINNWKDGDRGDGSKYRLLDAEEVRDSPAVSATAISHPDPSASSSQLLTEPGSLLPTVEVAPSLAGPAGQSRKGATGGGPGDPRPGSVSSLSRSPGLAPGVAGGHEAQGAAQPDGQLTMVGEPFRKRHAA